MSRNLSDTQVNWPKRAVTLLPRDTNLVEINALLSLSRSRVYLSGMPFYPPMFISVEKIGSKVVVRFAIMDRTYIHAVHAWAGYQMTGADFQIKLAGIAGGSDRDHLGSMTLGEAVEQLAQQTLVLRTAYVSYDTAFRWVGVSTLKQ